VRDIFSNKVAVITGGASGLGAALAKQLVAAGATVIIADIAREKAKKWLPHWESAHMPWVWMYRVQSKSIQSFSG